MVRSIRLRSVSTKTPNTAIDAGAAETISRANSGGQNRLLPAKKLRPTASAPALAANLISAAERTPQIFTQRRNLPTLLEQLAQGLAGAGRPHEGLANQEGINTERFELGQLLGVAEPALGDYGHGLGYERKEAAGDIDRGRKSL